MPYLFFLAFLLSIVSFLFYGGLCILTNKMNAEFERYGFLKYQRLIGLLEILGALGLVIGYFYKGIFIMSSFCLTLLMFSAVLVRIKIKDPYILWTPALFLFLVNLYLCYFAFRSDFLW